jgi:hypothetical protein
MRLPSSVTANFYNAVGRATGASTFTSVPMQASAAAPATSSGAPASTVVKFSDQALTMMRQRQVSEAQQATFKEVLQKAQSDQAQSDPKSFLRTLTADELSAVQSAHCLGQPIDVNKLAGSAWRGARPRQQRLDQCWRSQHVHLSAKQCT